ncbi:hypothetical protein M1432_02440 [Patescibacteria group bacterium]|nr:hypothetical protein [Patescibacteria group bacterium]
MRKGFVKFEEMQEPFYVRVELDEERVLFFMELFQNKAAVDPLLLTESKKLVDGRHRKAALIRLGRDGYDCNIIADEEAAKLILRAFKANFGGPKPPTSEDLDHTIELLLKEGMSRRSVLHDMSAKLSMPKELIRRHLDDVQSKMAKKKLTDAAAAVTDGNISVKEAAEKFGVAANSIRSRLRANAQKKDQVTEGEINTLKGNMTKGFHSLAMKNSHAIKKAIKAYKDGIVSKSEVEQMIAHSEHLIHSLEHSVAEWKKRFQKTAK